MSGPEHGTANAYRNHHCRCEPCTKANAEYHRNLRRVRRDRLDLLPESKHGKASTYRNHMCRCEPCTIAHTVERRQYG